MKALVSTAPGGPETLRILDLPSPQPGAGAVRLRVHACGINYPDVLIIEDRYQLRPVRPFAPGLEAAGVVDAVGEGVSDIAVGDRVMAFLNYGGLAEQVVCPELHCVRIPDAMRYEEAAGAMVTYGTSYHALKDRAALQPNETLLVLGAAGGVGLAAVELGHALGAHVVAAVSSEDKAGIARTAGADEVVIYPRIIDDPRALSASFKAAAPGGIDVIYDPVGGAHCEPALRSLAWAGRYLVIGFAGGIPNPPLNLVLLKSASMLGVAWGAGLERDPLHHRGKLLELLELYERGLIHPLVSEVYPIERGGEAIARLASRQAVGKLVVLL